MYVCTQYYVTCTYTVQGSFQTSKHVFHAKLIFILRIYFFSCEINLYFLYVFRNSTDVHSQIHSIMYCINTNMYMTYKYVDRIKKTWRNLSNQNDLPRLIINKTLYLNFNWLLEFNFIFKVQVVWLVFYDFRLNIFIWENLKKLVIDSLWMWSCQHPCSSRPGCQESNV